MTNSVQPVCTVCGEVIVGVDGSRGVRCGACFETYLRSVDAGFLEHFAEFGARARQVVAETCLRALVLANAGDRKLLGMTVYEQFVGAASDLIALVAALRDRASAPIARTFLDFQLDEDAAGRFFVDVSARGPAEWLALLDLPSPERVRPGLPAKIERDVRRSLGEAMTDLARLREYRGLGERALALAADHFRGGMALASRTEWLAGRGLSAVQVASVALDARHGRLDIAALRVDEERLAQIVDAIDVMTRLARNLTYAFVQLHEPDAFVAGFPSASSARAV